MAGNSRFYHFRNGVLLHRSNDQSLAQEMMNEKNRSFEINQHEEKSNLLNYLGKPTDFKPFISKKMKLADGDVLLLTTPGFWEDVNEVELADALELAKEPNQYIDLLEEVLLSRQKKVINNYTVATVFVNKVYQESNKKKKKYIKLIAAALIVTLLVGGSAMFYQAKQAKKLAELAVEMKDHEDTGNLYFEDASYEEALLEYSKGRNIAKQLKNPVHKNLLGTKLRVTQLIINGDESAEAGKFAEAMEHYEKARREGKVVKNFGKEEIEQRIANMDSVVQIVEATKDGDAQFDSEDYFKALATYEKARKKAVAVSFSGEPQIKIKIEETEEKIAELQKVQKELKAESLEQSGDNSYARQDYATALESYLLAQEIYQETELLAKVLGLERKIMNVNEKLNPVLPPPVADTSPAQDLSEDARNLDDTNEKGGE